MEVEASGQNSINLLETWRHHVSLGCHDDCAVPAALGLIIGGGDLAKVPRCPASDPLLEEMLKDVSCKAGRDGSDPNKKSLPTKQYLLQAIKRMNRTSTDPSSKFTFGISECRFQPLSLEPGQTPCRGVKRHRCLSDVDGFNTASMSSKKRRLRFELITSRLSQPYSQPATHILNREGQESGDKRFLKMATTLDSARRATHLHATSFLRYSTMNCLRKRLNLTHPGAVARRDDQEAVAVVSKANKAAWRLQSLQASSAGKSLKLSPLPNGGTGIMPTTPPLAPQVAPTRHHHTHHHSAKPLACRLSNPVALPLPVTDVAATKKLPSPRIHPIRSPELRPSRGFQQLDDLEEDSFAFLHPPVDDDYDWDEVGCSNGDDQEDSVYSDFSVMFGQDAPSGAEATNDDRTYEEYLDELDGICWVSR